MDLNASPLPEEDEETFERNLEATTTASDHVESAIDIFKREREERRNRLKRERADDSPSYTSQNHRLKDSQNNRFYDKSRLPPGWLDCPAFGHEIFGIIPSKVPLGESFNEYIAPGNRYSFKQVIHRQRVLGRKLGLVVDLTNTTRYYPASDLNKEGIKHVKFQCRGRDSVPDNESVNSFVHEVSQFFCRQKQQKRFVFVHCTHGHNRTGFMIVHYLMRTMGTSVTQALNIFYEARPPGIYKLDYIDALYAFYHERKPDGLMPPSTPEWKKSSDFDLNGDAKADDDTGGTSPVRENQEAKIIMTNDDVLGDAIPFDQQDTLRVFCYQLLFGAGFTHPRGKNQFPGSHPVSLNRDNIQLLRQRYYYATWKADGTRYMMLITIDGCYLIDRNFCFRRVQMKFPCRNITEGAVERTHHFTLLDGEMIIDTLPDSSKERRYLIYDLMALNQVSVIELPFYERWKLLDVEVVDPRKNNKNPCYRYDLEPFRIRRKNFWLLSAVNKLLKKFISTLSHGADGLIFQGWDDPYIPRTHEGLLKWKYPEMNSVDFLFEVGDEDKFLLYLFDRGRKLLMEGNHVVFPDSFEPVSLSGKIIECAWDGEGEVWFCMRVRTDKSTPNEINTYKKVLRSIKDNITEDILQKEIEEIQRFPMYVERMEMDSKAHQRQQQSKKQQQQQRPE